MTVEYPDLSDYIAVASAVTGIEPGVVLASMKADLADSALHAPAGSWSDEDFYPDFIDKAAVLLVRLAKNHPLLDGNKRAAWVILRLFVERLDVAHLPGCRRGRASGLGRLQQRIGRGTHGSLAQTPAGRPAEHCR